MGVARRLRGKQPPPKSVSPHAPERRLRGKQRPQAARAEPQAAPTDPAAQAKVAVPLAHEVLPSPTDFFSSVCKAKRKVQHEIKIKEEPATKQAKIDFVKQEPETSECFQPLHRKTPSLLVSSLRTNTTARRRLTLTCKAKKEMKHEIKEEPATETAKLDFVKQEPETSECFQPLHRSIASPLVSNLRTNTREPVKQPGRRLTFAQGVDHYRIECYKHQDLWHRNRPLAFRTD